MKRANVQSVQMHAVRALHSDLLLAVATRFPKIVLLVLRALKRRNAEMKNGENVTMRYVEKQRLLQFLQYGKELIAYISCRSNLQLIYH